MPAPADSTAFFLELERTISKPRLDSYRQNGETSEEALCKYLWNVRLCEVLYAPLQMLEVGFRNALHTEVASATRTPEWLKSSLAILYSEELKKIEEAKRSLSDRKHMITEPFLVAEMSFGFWTSLLDARYDKLWHKIIANVFPNMPRHMRTRRDVSVIINRIRRLRNAALHHHSIWHWSDLEAHHADILRVLGWISPSLRALAVPVDQFQKAFREGHIYFRNSERVAASSNLCSVRSAP